MGFSERDYTMGRAQALRGAERVFFDFRGLCLLILLLLFLVLDGFL